MPRTSQDRQAIFILAGLCVVVYFNSFWNTFAFDDLHGILNNLYIKDLRYAPLLFKGHYTSIPEIPKGMFRPLLLLSFAFNYFFSGQNPLGFHIINTLIHFLNGVLLYFLLRLLKSSLPFGLTFFISALFLSHPIHSETVTYISCRSDLLVTFFVMSAFFCYIKGRHYLSSFIYILALLTKETALVFPFLAFAYQLICSSTEERSRKKNAGILYALLCITALYWIYRGTIFHINAQEIILSPAKSGLRGFSSNIYLQTVVSLFYLRLFLWPHPLSLHHIFPHYNSLLEPIVIFSTAAIALFLILAIISRKKYPLISLGVFWYFICLLPKFYGVLNFPAMEHHFYLPSIGIYCILAGSLELPYLKFNRKFRILGLGIISMCTLLVWARNCEWRDNLALYACAVRDDPASAVAHSNLGIEYSRIGLEDAAEAEYKKALSLSNSADVQINCRMNLALLYAKEERFKGALEEVHKALEINPNYPTIYQTYGAIYFEMGQKEKAGEIWNQGLSLSPNSPGILNNLGILSLERNDLKDAWGYFQAAIKTSPDDFFAYFKLGQISEREDIQSAIRYYNKSVRLNPDYALSHYNLGKLYITQLNPRALYHLKETIRLNPLLSEAHNDLAVFYASMEPQRLDLAREHAQKALSLGYPVEKEFLKLIGIEEEKKGSESFLLDTTIQK